MIPQQFIDGLNRDADLADIIGRYVKLERKGSSVRGLCPFHNEKTPSFNVVESKGFYHCFGCGASGTALGFLKEHAHGGDFLAAVHDLAKILGREIPTSSRSSGTNTAPILGAAEAYYAAQLSQTTAAQNYLKKRGLNAATATRYNLGYAPQDGGLAAIAPNKDRLVLAAGLAKRGDDGKQWPYFRDRIMFPIRASSSAKVVGFGGRTLTDREPKYLNSPQNEYFDKSRLLYGLSEATAGFKEQGFALVVEGYLDVLVLAHHGLDCAVATMGTAVTAAQMRLLLNRCKNVICCFDGDNAGRRAAFKALGNLMPALTDGCSVRFAFLPEGEDPDSYVRKHGPDRLKDLCANQSSSLEQMLTELPDPDADYSTDEGRESKTLRHACSLLESIDQDKAPFMYGVLYRHLEESSGQSSTQLQRAAQAAKLGQPRQFSQPNSTPATRRKMKEHDLYKIIACLHADLSLASKCEDLQVYCESESDHKLFLDLIEYLNNAPNTSAGAERASVGQFLKERNLLGLLAQLDQTIKNWAWAGISADEQFEICGRHMRRKLAKSQSRLQVGDKLDKKLQGPADVQDRSDIKA